MTTLTKQKSWIDSLKTFKKPSVIIMLFLGLSAGIPILLIFSSLSLWLREAGVERATVTFFSWAALGYSFKFVWAPLVDRMPIPILTHKLGRRRSWILLSQISIIIAILAMAFTDPQNSQNALTLMALAAILLGFSSATQDIAIDAYRIECDRQDMQATLSSVYIAGYRIGMIVAGAGALFLASWFGSSKAEYNYQAWMFTYILMAASMLVGVVTTLFMPEPRLKRTENTHYNTQDYGRFFVLFVIIALSFIASFFFTKNTNTQLKIQLTELLGKGLGNFLAECLRLGFAILVSIITTKLLLKTPLVNQKMVDETYVLPVKDFFQRYGTSTALLLLSLVGLYRISDIVLGVISNVFYQDLGFNKEQIAAIVKTFGLIMTLAGGFLGGLFTVRFGVMRMLFWGAVLSAGTNLLFMGLASMGKNLPMLYLVISVDNLAAGLASAAFIAFLSSLTNISFTAVQYAIFSSLMTLLPKVIGGYSGSMVDTMGYSGFFLSTSLMGLPVLYLVHLAGKKLELNKK